MIDSHARVERGQGMEKAPILGMATKIVFLYVHKRISAHNPNKQINIQRASYRLDSGLVEVGVGHDGGDEGDSDTSQLAQGEGGLGY